MPRSRFADLCLALVFLAGISASAVAMLVRRGGESTGARENRHTEPWPGWPSDGAELEQFPARFTGWFGDEFGLRRELVELNNRVKVDGFGIAPTPRLLIGRDDWVFDTYALSLEMVRGSSPLSESELALWQIALESRRNWVEARGGTHVFALIPRKGGVYPEQLPFELERVGPSRREQLLRHLRAHSDLVIVDLLPSLLEAKKEDRAGAHLFYPFGSHWTDLGAFAVYREIMRALQRVGVGDGPMERSAFELRADGVLPDGWGRRLYMEGRFKDSEQKLWPRSPAKASRVEGEGQVGYRNEVWRAEGVPALRVTLLHDSFGAWIIPRFAEHFSEMHTYREGIFDPESLAGDDPDVVIELFSELMLVEAPPNLLASQMQAELRAAFDGSDRVLMRVDDPTGLQLEPPFLKALLTAESGTLVVDVKGPPNAVRLPRFDFPTRGLAVVAVDLDSVAGSRVDLLFRKERSDAFTGRASVHASTQAGRRRVFLPITAREMTGELIMRVGMVPGRHVLHSVEARQVSVGALR